MAEDTRTPGPSPRAAPAEGLSEAAPEPPAEIAIARVVRVLARSRAGARRRVAPLTDHGKATEDHAKEL